MKSKYIYMILLMAGMLFSCQRPELSDPDVVLRPEEGMTEEVTLTFSALLPSSPTTKAMGDTPVVGEDIKSMHLVVFDENGMLVETREATIVGQKAHASHLYETEFKVTLTVTDSPRSIHFIANCPVNQIAYGHEVSIIGNLYVQKDNEPATPETAYWARIEVPYIKYHEVEVDGKKQNVLDEGIQANFKCIPMLRNFAQVVVTDATGDGDLFKFLGFSIYNTIDIGTVAPYNNTTQKFQSFLDTDGSKYSYPELTALNYKGHALAAAELKTELPKDANGNVIFYEEYDPTEPDDPNSIFYMYERRISARTDQEELWDESPPHVIVKGEYDNKVYYYKVDLVYDVIDDKGTPDKTDDVVTDIEYYNILRNFRYQFTIKAVSGEGYDSIEEAIQGSTSNNLSGSSTTAKFTNISDTKGRLWVSYTDTTLVNSNQITLKYKYVPNLGDLDANNEPKINNALVNLGNVAGDIIEGLVKTSDITNGTWAGYREVTFSIKEPENTVKEQTLQLKTNNPNLSRDIRYYLRQRFPLEIECTPKVEAKINAPVELDIKLPIGLTDDLFPLDLAIEVYDMTLSPDASKNTLPVETSVSVIPLPEKQDKATFHFVKTFETKAEYDALTTVGNRKIFKTYWLTNTANNESTIYVVNKYFNVASDNFINAKAFVAASIDPAQIAYGIGKTASISFTMDPNDADYNSRTMTVTLNGLTHPNAVTNADGTVTLSVKPSGNRVVTVNGLTTTTEDKEVSFTVEEESYAPITATASRRAYKFTDLTIPDRILRGVGRKVNISFTMDAADDDYANREVTVSFDGLADANGNNVITVKPQPGSRKVEIKGLLTTSDNGAVQFTVSTAGYDNANSARVTERPRGLFTPVSFTYRNQTVTNIPTTGDEDVTFNFNLSDWEEGMAINVTLDGLEDNDVSLELPARAVASYVYYPQAAGSHSIRLKSTSGAKTCRVSLSADGFEPADGTLTQSDIQKGRIPKNRTISGTLENVPNSPNGQNNKDFIIAIDGNESKTFKANIIRTNIGSKKNPIYEYSYTITINANWDIEYTDPNQLVTITVTFQNDKYSGTCIVQQLINANLTGVELSR